MFFLVELNPLVTPTRLVALHSASTEEGSSWYLAISENGRRSEGMRHGNHCRIRSDPSSATYIANRPILTAYQEGERRRGSMPWKWWWEQPMCLETIDATGSDVSDGHLVAFTATDA